MHINLLKNLKDVFKACKCGTTYDHEAWHQLRVVGIQKGIAKRNIPDLELRNCSSCRSTLAVDVDSVRRAGHVVT